MVHPCHSENKFPLDGVLRGAGSHNAILFRNNCALGIVLGHIMLFDLGTIVSGIAAFKNLILKFKVSKL
jgi:hypothetical protein